MDTGNLTCIMGIHTYNIRTWHIQRKNSPVKHSLYVNITGIPGPAGNFGKSVKPWNFLSNNLIFFFIALFIIIRIIILTFQMNSTVLWPHPTQPPRSAYIRYTGKGFLTTPFLCLLAWALDGCPKKAFALIMKPGVQKPHWKA